MSTILWILFWIAFFLLYGLLGVELPGSFYYPYIAILLNSQFWFFPHFDVPDMAFWVMFSFLLRSCLRQPRSLGTGVFWVLVFNRWPINRFEVDPKITAVTFWLGFTLFPILAWLFFTTRLSPWAVFSWVAATFIMRDLIFMSMAWYWNAAWGLLLGALIHTLPPDMPTGWYLFWMVVIPSLGLAIRPDQSLGRFFSWVGAFYVLRIVSYPIYLMYFRAPEKDKLFPFNLFRHKWRLSHPQWYPIRLRPRDSAIEGTRLCPRCETVTSESKLIMGTTSWVTRLEEWHSYGTLGDLRSSVSGGASSCHLCHIFWYSIGKDRRIGLLEKFTQETSPRPGSEVPSGDMPGLRIRIWEERPLTLYTYAQLFMGDRTLGARILIHREGIHETRMSPMAAIQPIHSACWANNSSIKNMSLLKHRFVGAYGPSEEVA